MNEDAIIGDIYNLTDEDGQEEAFKLIGKCEYEGKVYYAFQSLDEENETFKYICIDWYIVNVFHDCCIRTG